MLPPKEHKTRTTDDELSDAEDDSPTPYLTESERLFAAFQKRHIRLRLHGSRLPPDYTVSLRLPTNNYRSAQPGKPKRKRRRIDPAKAKKRTTELLTDSDSDDASFGEAEHTDNAISSGLEAEQAALASEDEEDTAIRANNAYTGATNTIGSVHQRHWFLTLDRRNSGFRKASGGQWEGGWAPFFVMGREVETSVVTGRKADEVMEDEGVSKFVGRKMWRPIME